MLTFLRYRQALEPYLHGPLKNDRDLQQKLEHYEPYLDQPRGD